MSKVQSQRPRKFNHRPSFPHSCRWTDFGLWTLDFGLLLVLCAVNVCAQDTKCTLKLAELPAAPELFGFHMGMTTPELKVHVPQVEFGKADDFGVLKTSISPDFDPKMDKASLAGIRTVSFDFLDGRLTSLWLGYDGTFKWKTVRDFVEGISQSLHLRDADAAAWDTWRERGQQLKCVDFQMTVVMVSEGPSWHIIDATAEKIIAERREAKEELDSAREAGETGETKEMGQTVGILGDTKLKVYYLESCPPAIEIKPERRTVFKTTEAAEKAGYRLARDCR